MIKRVFAVFIALLFVITLTACGTAQDLLNQEETPPSLPPAVSEATGNEDSTPTDNAEARYLDNCAKAWAVCYASCPHFDERNISAIYYAKDDTIYSMMYGENTVTIISDFLGTECTYIVSSKLDETLSEIFPYFYNEEYNLYIHGIGTQNFETGWLKDGWDYVTDTYVMVAEMECESMAIDTVKTYKKDHYKN